MSNFVKRADKIVETTTNVLFIVVASFVVIVVGVALFRLLMGAVVDPIYSYLAPRLGVAKILMVVLSQENKGLEFTALMKVVWEVVPKL